MTEPDLPPDILDELPAQYVLALRLQRAGLPPAELAARLEIPVESVGAALRLAEAKLAAARARHARAPDDQ
jgi:DNA-directed RNA polymerase specialized sigma24 family protein